VVIKVRNLYEKGHQKMSSMAKQWKYALQLTGKDDIKKYVSFIAICWQIMSSKKS